MKPAAALADIQSRLKPGGDTEAGPPEREVDGREAANPSTVFIRRLVFCVVVAACAGLALWSNDSPDVGTLLPYFFVAITLQFLPMFWPADADAFAPAALPALLIGPELIAELLRAIRVGSVDIVFLDGLPPATRVELVQKVLILWILSSSTYLAGYYLGFGRGRIATIFPRVGGMVWNKPRLQLASAVCLAAFLVAYTFFQTRVDASLTDVTALAEGKAVWREDPTTSWMGRGVLLGGIPLLFLVASVAAKPTTFRVLFAAGACALMALLETRLGQRGYAFSFVLSCMIVVHNVHKRFKIGVLMTLGFAALIAFNIMGEWRRGEPDSAVSRTPYAARVLAPDEAILSFASDRNRLSVLGAVMHYIPERRDYLMGESYVALFAAPIPKWIWPEKDDYFKWRDSAIAGNLHGIPGPTPMQGVFYANFSWIGVAVGMFLWGLFQRGLYEWLLKDQFDKNAALLYSGMVLYLAPSNLAMASTLQYVVPMWIIIKFAGRRLGGVRIRLPRAQATPAVSTGDAA